LINLRELYGTCLLAEARPGELSPIQAALRFDERRMGTVMANLGRIAGAQATPAVLFAVPGERQNL
jgi:hypothetical protein